MHSGFRNQIKSMMDAQKQLSKASADVVKNEPSMYEKLMAEEKAMAEADGIAYSEEEMVSNVTKQMENNPFRLAFYQAKKNFEEAAKRG